MTDTVQAFKPPPSVEYWHITRADGSMGRRGFGPIGCSQLQKLGPGETIQTANTRPAASNSPAELPMPALELLRERRNKLIESSRWTIMPDSPLTQRNQAEWLVWLRAMHRVVMENTPEARWPTMPELVYA